MLTLKATCRDHRKPQKRRNNLKRLRKAARDKNTWKMKIVKERTKKTCIYIV